MKTKIDINEIIRLSREAVLAAEGVDGDGLAKARAAVDHLITAADAAHQWPATPAGAVGEAVDGIFLRFVASVIVKRAYDDLKRWREGKDDNKPRRMPAWMGAYLERQTERLG